MTPLHNRSLKLSDRTGAVLGRVANQETYQRGMPVATVVQIAAGVFCRRFGASWEAPICLIRHDWCLRVVAKPTSSSRA